MDPLVIIFRFTAISIAVFWAIQLGIAVRRPADWRPSRADKFPIPVSRNLYIVGAVLGFIAGCVIYGLSFVIYP